MSNYRVETGIQFLTRIKKSKSDLTNVDEIIFPKGLKENDLIELTAETAYCKNAILMYLMRKIILIDTFESVPIGGLNTSILYIDTAFQLKVKSFFSYLRNYTNKLLLQTFTAEKEEEIIKKSFENVIVVRCYDSQQLLVTFDSLHTVITSNPRIKLIIFDNVGANYWQDFFNGGIKPMLKYERQVLSALQSRVKDFKLPILYVRPEFFVAKHPLGNDIANCKIRIKQKDIDKQMFEATVSTKSVSYSKIFVISHDEIAWL